MKARTTGEIRTQMVSIWMTVEASVTVNVKILQTYLMVVSEALWCENIGAGQCLV